MTQSDRKLQDYLPGFPMFAQEFAATLAVHSQYVLHGNIRDLYLVSERDGRTPDGVRPVRLIELLWRVLRHSGFRCLLVSDQIHGISVYPPQDTDALAAAQQVLGPKMLGRRHSLESLRTCLARVTGVSEPSPLYPESPAEKTAAPAKDLRAALVIDYASRITRSQGALDPAERDFFLFAQKLADTAQTRLGGPDDRPVDLFNPVIWLTEGERDLPAWLTVGMERVRSISVPNPGLADRIAAARYFAPIITRRPTSPEDEDADLTRFALRTDDMTLHSIREVARISADRGIPLGQIDDAIRIYRIGVERSPWRHEAVRQQIMLGEKEIPARIMGQEAAVIKAFDILKRAALGLSGAQASGSANRPRGVLFLAGPSGVGKTELARQLATTLFGDPEAYLRFDMSEFSASHSADRLIGAPPGYVGHEAGGELTGAIRRKPFSVVLFDEVEKAHPQILDKFLQILEDGRLTDGQGVTSYFSECVLVFTSNLGIIQTDARTGESAQSVTPEMPYEELEQIVKDAIRHHFTAVLGRPELLNRFGDNIVVFDFIHAPAAELILEAQLRNVRDRLAREQGILMELSETAAARLNHWCTTSKALVNGGRGIGSTVESKLINPLARYLFDADVQSGTVIVDDILTERGVVTLIARHEP